MSSHKNHEHLERIKDAVTNTDTLNASEKTETIKRIEEWIAEDKAEGIIYEELIEIANSIKPLLAELGLIN